MRVRIVGIELVRYYTFCYWASLSSLGITAKSGSPRTVELVLAEIQFKLCTEICLLEHYFPDLLN